MLFNQCARALLALTLLAASGFAQTSDRIFPYQGESVITRDLSDATEVAFQAMRFNRALNVWNVEVTISNKSPEVLMGPLFLSIESFANTPGPMNTDGPMFYLFTESVAPGARTQPRTLTLGRGAGSPTMTAKVFGGATKPFGGVAFVRTLNEVGQPLPEVQVVESGPEGVRIYSSDAEAGLVTLGQGSGLHTWRFSKPDYVSVWRSATLVSNQVTVLPHPRLAPIGSNLVTILSPQTLPGLLPLGWSPAQAFWTESAGDTQIRPNGFIPRGRSVVLARFSQTELQWETIQILSGDGTNNLTASIPGPGAYILAVADSGPSPAVGSMLIGRGVPAEPSSIQASGDITPSAAPASRSREAVTALAQVTFTNVGPLPSGTEFRAQIRDVYRLNDGTIRVQPQYDNALIGYQFPGDNDPATLHASFPVQPLVLFGPDELERATVLVNVLLPNAFTGALLQESGGEIRQGPIRISAEPGDVIGHQAIELRLLDPTNYLSLAPTGLTVLQAFQVNVAGIAPGRELHLSPIPSNAIVARVLLKDGLFGLEPAGITKPGQYLLMQLDRPHGTITGTTIPGNAVRIGGQPWLTIADSNGIYRLLAPTGPVQLVTTDLGSGDSGDARTILTIAGTTLDLSSQPSGPRVVSISPAPNATAVPRVTSVVINFSEPINPGTLAAQLLDTNGQPVAAALTLNLRNSTLSLLPTHQLAPSAAYTIALSTNIADLTGLKLEGTNLFTFTTETDRLARGAGAHLISYEPANGVAAIAGSPGLAEPDSPVILVNETSGRTATILSKPDGSFTNSIEASVDDFLSAVIVNNNGTRNTVPVSRQLFRDGSVGLFQGGGILEAQSDGGPVQVIIEPAAIPEKTKFKLEPVPVAQLLALLSNTPPQSGKVLAGFKFIAEGDELKTSADVSFPVNLADLNLTPGESPTNRSFALMQPIQVDGMTVYHVVDSMRYEDGRVVSHSPPFDGLLALTPGAGVLFTLVMMPVLFMQQLTVLGAVVLVPESVAPTVTTEMIQAAYTTPNPNIRPLPGAIVTAYPSSLASASFARPGLQPGTFVARANRAGLYRFLLPYNPFEADATLVIARHDRIPNLIGRKIVGRDSFTKFVTADVIITRPDAPTGGFDHNPPLISASPSNLVQEVGTNVTIPFLLRDDFSKPKLVSVTFDPQLSIADTGHAFPSNSVAQPVIGEAVILNPTTVRVPVTFHVTNAGAAVFKVQAEDEDFNTRTIPFTFQFGPPSTNITGQIPPSDPADITPPQVLSVTPEDGVTVQPGDSFLVRFTEAVRPTITNGTGIIISDQATVRILLSDDQLSARLFPGSIKSGQTYTLTINSEVKDIVGNPLDQDPSTPGLQAFQTTFRTPTILQTTMPDVQTPAGSLTFGNYSFTLDRQNNAPLASLKIHRLRAIGPSVFSAVLPPYPRAMTLIPKYSFQTRPNTAPETKPLLAIVGGLTGDTQIGQWIRIFDISHPEHPQQLVGTLISTDPTAIAANIKFSPPRLALHLITLEGGLLQIVNLQALILGDNYTQADFAASPDPNQFIPGKDLNQDGDYTDPGETLPIPQRNALFGLESVTPAAPGREFTDFDFASGGAFIIGTLMQGDSNQPPSLQVFTFEGLPVGNGDTPDGAFPFLDDRPFRCKLDLELPVPGPDGTRIVPAALVTGTKHLFVLDISDPLTPRLINKIKIADDPGTIFSINRTGENEYALGASSGVYFLARSALDLVVPEDHVHPAINSIVPIPVNGRSLGISPYFIAASSAAGVNVGFLAPRLAVVQAPTNTVTSVESLILGGTNAIKSFLTGTAEQPFVLPAVVNPLADSLASDVTPPNPLYHHYVLVSGSGDLGPEIPIAIESLDASGHLLPAKGPFFPPVILIQDANQLNLQAAQAPSASLTARRLSEDPGSEFYNLYLSDPFVGVREQMFQADRDAVAAFPNRKAIWSGNFIRASIAPVQSTGPGLSTFASRVVQHAYQPGVSKSYFALPGDYIDTPNPSLAASPNIAGVNLQSGEFRTKATDIQIQGRHQPLVLTRSYDSRSVYSGPLGRGWDFNWNVRILEMPKDISYQLNLTHYGNPNLDVAAAGGDVMVIDGNGGLLYFRAISEENGNTNVMDAYSGDPAIAGFDWSERIATFYESPRGELSVLYKFKDGSFVNVTPAGVRTYFQHNGRLDRIVGAYAASVLSCFYRSDGRLDRVRGDRGIELEFGYYVDASILDTRQYDRPADARIKLGLLSRVRIGAPQGITGEVAYDYDGNGNLQKVIDLSGSEYLYGYDAAEPHLLTSIGRGDGAQTPAQTISYTDGLVSKVTQDAETTTFTGAKKTAEDRFNTPSETLTVAIGENAPAAFPVDNRGRPTRLGTNDFRADDEGRFTRVASSGSSSEIVYDTENPVHRFQGNILGTGQVGSPSFTTLFAYDGSAWNRVKERTTTEGVTITTDYEDNGTYVNKVLETTGPVRQVFSFNEFGQLLREEKQEDGHVLVRTTLYDNSGLVQGEKLGDLPEVALQRSGNKINSFSKGGIQYGVTYNSDAQLESLTPATPGFPSVGLNYQDGLITEEVIGDGGFESKNTYVYDSTKSRVKEAILRETGLPDSHITYTYDPFGRIDFYNRDGDITDFTYEAGNLTKLRGPGFSREVTFDGALPAKITEQGLTAVLQYDGEKRVNAITQQGATTEFSFLAGEKVASKKITATNVVLLDETYNYDEAGRLKEVISGEATKSFDYFADGKVRRVRLNDQLVRELERDSAGRVTLIRLPKLVEFRYSDFDPVTGLARREERRLIPSYGDGSTYIPYQSDSTYDGRGRLKSRTWPCGTWYYRHDAFGNLTNQIDPDGVAESHRFSPGGLMLSSTFSDGTSVDFVYDAGRHLRRVGDMTFNLSATERLMDEIVYPDGAVTTYSLRNELFEPTVVNIAGVSQQHTWENGRLKRIAAADELEYSYDGLGRVVAVRLNNYTTELGYSDAGQFSKEETRTTTPNTPPRAWEATFDEFNHLVSEDYPSGLSIEWGLATNGLPAGADELGISAIEWQGPGVLGAVAYSGGLRMVQVYDNSLRLFAIRYQTGPPESPTNVADFSYSLTPAGRILSEERSHEGRVDVYKRNSNLVGMRITDFFLSATNQTNGSGSSVELHGFTFDSNGEVSPATNAFGADARSLSPTTFSVNGRIIEADGVTVSYNPQGAVSQVPVWVRLPGQLALTRETATLTYDDVGMLKRVQRGSGQNIVTVNYTRDGFGRIVQREVIGPAERCRPGLRQYAWKANQLIEEYDWNGNDFELVRRYAYLGPKLVRVESLPVPSGELEEYVPLASLNGSVAGFATPDGDLKEMILYGPYGTPVFKRFENGTWLELERSSIGNTLLFQQRWFDEETGLYQLGQRNLHPQLARFLQRDNKLYGASRALFTAFNGDPAGKVDPSGALPEEYDNIKEQLDAAKEFKDKGIDLLKAIDKGRIGAERTETDLGNAALDFVSAGLSFASTQTGEEFQEFSKKTVEHIDNIKTGLEILQAAADIRRERQLLLALKAHALSPENYSPRMKWIAQGGAAADYEVLTSDAFAQAGLKEISELEAHSAEARTEFYKKRSAYVLNREENILKIGQGAHKLAEVYMNYAFAEDDHSRGTELGRAVLGASGQLLTLAEKLHEVKKDKDLAELSFAIGDANLAEWGQNLYGKAVAVHVAFEAGFKLGQYAIIALSDPQAAAEYKAAVKQFNENGGFLSVFGGVLATAGFDSTAYRLQRLSQFSAYDYFVQPYVDIVTKPDPKLDFYLRGADAL